MFGITMAASGDEFVAPGPNSFDFSEVPLFHLGGLGSFREEDQILHEGVLGQWRASVSSGRTRERYR